MAPSRTPRPTLRALRRVLACGFALVVPLAACGQVTGLSDDYHFDQLEAGGSLADGGNGQTGDASTQSDAPSDAAADVAPDARETCTATQQATAQEQLTTAGATLGTQCRSCLVANCCQSINHCSTGGGECDNSMKCVFGCQNKQSNPKAQCLAGCSDVFETTIGACVRSACANYCSLF